MIPIIDNETKKNIDAVSSIIMSELNIKEIIFLDEKSTIIKKQIKPNFKTLGPKFGKKMKFISEKISKFTLNDITEIEKNNNYQINDEITITLSDVEISSADIPGFSMASNNGITVALDITLSKALKEEGLAREFVNRIQGLRKDNGFKVTDNITIL